ncbi:MAG TPA: hypothetical protein ENK57_14795 [Polyangiaceae bacterium]|nr:hypothetical protein [Polyangiaceae bacterium]
MSTIATMIAELDRLCENARRLRKETHHVAIGASFLSAFEGFAVRSRCVHCATDDHVAVRRVHLGGDCYGCGSFSSGGSLFS